MAGSVRRMKMSIVNEQETLNKAQRDNDASLSNERTDTDGHSRNPFYLHHDHKGEERERGEEKYRRGYTHPAEK